MKLEATVIDLVEANCDHCVVKASIERPYPAILTLKIDDELGAGFLADEWHGTFSPGREVTFDVDPADDLRVDAFQVGDYSRRR